MPGYEVMGEEERDAVNEIFDKSGGVLFAHGFDSIRNGIYKVREFESKLAIKFKVPYTLAVSSGTAALRVALAAMNIGPGDEVIIPCFTFVATAEAVIQSGADMVIVDIDSSLNMDPLNLRNKITQKTKCIIPVHMLGAPADMDSIMKVSTEYNIPILEDSAQAVGGLYKNKVLGTIGHMGIYSFDAGKVIITGEGGMVVTSDQKLFIKARAYHDHGHEYSTSVSRGEEGAIGEGFNYRMTELQGAIGIVQLSKLDMILQAQRSNKAKLKNLLAGGGFPFRFRNIHDTGELGDAIVFFLENREQTAAFLRGMKAEGIGTKNVPDAMRWHFAKHWSHMFEKYGWYKNTYRTQWQKSADILECAVALPVMVKMTDERIAEIGEKIKRIGQKIL